MAGCGNQPLSRSTKRAILKATRDALGSKLIEVDEIEALHRDPRPARGIVRAEALGRAKFTGGEIETIAGALREIRGRSLAPDNGAYCIVEMPNGFYVQFLARTDQPWLWTEISSHRWLPEVANHLNEDVVTFIEACTFSWPLDKANFGVSLTARTDADCESAGAFALGALRIVFGHRSGSPLEISVQIPRANGSGMSSAL
jgi:hypothetical protein